MNRVVPKYPEEAKTHEIQGAVKLHVVLDADGSVQQVQVVSDDPELAKAAVDAVKQWRCQPTLLNGQPAEVDTMIDVVFSLANEEGLSRFV
jgi:TonB family protein